MAVKVLGGSAGAGLKQALAVLRPGSVAMGVDNWQPIAGWQAGSGAGGNFAPALNQLIAMPFLPGLGGTFSGLAFGQAVAGGGGSVTRLGVYVGNPITGYPGALVPGSDTGSVATDAANGTKITAVTFALSSGLLYYLTMLCGVAAPTVNGYAVGTAYEMVLGLAGGVPNALNIGWNVAFAFAALPAVFPAGGTIRGGGAGIPYMAARLL